MDFRSLMVYHARIKRLDYDINHFSAQTSPMEKDPPQETVIPDKLYFKIGEVTAITGLPGYVLRFWESEFSAICPKRTESGQRLYRKVDIEVILKIKNLLYNQRFTIPGARQHLKGLYCAKPRSEPHTVTLEEICEELISLRELLSE